MSWFIGKKTFIVSILMFSVSLLNLITGDISLYEFIYGFNEAFCGCYGTFSLKGWRITKLGRDYLLSG